MALTIARPPIPASTSNRTFRAVLDTPVNGAYGITVYREDVDRDADGVVMGPTRPTTQIYRPAADIANEEVVIQIGGVNTTITATQVMLALPLFFDRWTQEGNIYPNPGPGVTRVI